jgi:hypothetical protein
MLISRSIAVIGQDFEDPSEKAFQALMEVFARTNPENADVYQANNPIPDEARKLAYKSEFEAQDVSRRLLLSPSRRHGLCRY